MALYDLLKKFNKNKLFVETGIFHGGGIRSAIASNMFNEIHSIDINENYVEIAKNNFSNNKNVFLHTGDSGIVLEDIIKNMDGGITFWLDAHHCGSDSGGSDKYVSPIQRELNIIKNSKHREKHILLIDDINYFSEENIQINEERHPTKDVGYMLKEDLIARLKDINSEFKIQFFNINNGVCVATPY